MSAKVTGQVTVYTLAWSPSVILPELIFSNNWSRVLVELRGLNITAAPSLIYKDILKLSSPKLIEYTISSPRS